MLNAQFNTLFFREVPSDSTGERLMFLNTRNTKKNPNVFQAYIEENNNPNNTGSPSIHFGGPGCVNMRRVIQMVMHRLGKCC